MTGKTHKPPVSGTLSGSPSDTGKRGSGDRSERLKAALRANLLKRKAQARSKGAGQGGTGGTKG